MPIQYLSGESGSRTETGGSALKAELVEGDTVPLLQEGEASPQVVTHSRPVLVERV